MVEEKKVVNLMLLTFLVFLLTVYALSEYSRIYNVGRVVIAGEVIPSESTIDWGDVYVGEPKNHTITLTNNGTEAVSNLTFTIENPSVNLINFSVTWNLTEGFDLLGGESVAVIFTLVIYEADVNVTDAFSFDIVIQGEP